MYLPDSGFQLRLCVSCLPRKTFLHPDYKTVGIAIGSHPDYNSISHRINCPIACFIQTGCFQPISCSVDSGKYYGCNRFHFCYVNNSLLFQSKYVSNVENVWIRCCFLVIWLEHNRVSDTPIIFNRPVYGLAACMAYDNICHLPLDLLYILGIRT